MEAAGSTGGLPDPLVVVERLEAAASSGDREAVALLLDLDARSRELYPELYAQAGPGDRARFRAFLLEGFFPLLRRAAEAPRAEGERRLVERLPEGEARVRIESGPESRVRGRSYDLAIVGGRWQVLRSHRWVEGRPIDPGPWARKLRSEAARKLGRAPTLGDLARLGPEVLGARGAKVFRVPGAGARPPTGTSGSSGGP